MNYCWFYSLFFLHNSHATSPVQQELGIHIIHIIQQAARSQHRAQWAGFLILFLNILSLFLEMLDLEQQTNKVIWTRLGASVTLSQWLRVTSHIISGDLKICKYLESDENATNVVHLSDVSLRKLFLSNVKEVQSNHPLSGTKKACDSLTWRQVASWRPP